MGKDMFPLLDEFKESLGTWKELCQDYLDSKEFTRVYENTKAKYAKETCYPPPDLIFNAFKLTKLNNIKVVIVGQDPYHQKGQAMGLAFSVNKGVKVPPSLKNMYKAEIIMMFTEHVLAKYKYLHMCAICGQHTTSLYISNVELVFENPKYNVILCSCSPQFHFPYAMASMSRSTCPSKGYCYTCSHSSTQVIKLPRLIYTILPGGATITHTCHL